MKVAERLSTQYGSNIRESMGVGTSQPAERSLKIPPSASPREPEAKLRGCVKVKGAVLIDIDRIVSDPNQPRKSFDQESLDRLADSLRERGQLEPVRVRWDDALERWVIIAGERRWRAAVAAGLPKLAAVEASGPLSPDDILEDQLVENCLRENLKPIEQARAYDALMRSRGLSQRRLADKLRIGQASIARAVALLGLSAEIQRQIDAGEIAPTTSYEIARADDPEKQSELAREAAAGRLRTDQAHRRVGATKRKPVKSSGRLLPAEIKCRGPNGVRLVAMPSARHTAADVAAGLRFMADRIESEAAEKGQGAV